MTYMNTWSISTPRYTNIPEVYSHAHTRSILTHTCIKVYSHMHTYVKLFGAVFKPVADFIIYGVGYWARPLTYIVLVLLWGEWCCPWCGLLNGLSLWFLAMAPWGGELDADSHSRLVCNRTWTLHLVPTAAQPSGWTYGGEGVKSR